MRQGAPRGLAFHGRVGHRWRWPMLLVHRVIPPQTPSASPPLLVLLHGIGADEADLVALAPSLDRRFLIVSARLDGTDGAP